MLIIIIVKMRINMTDEYCSYMCMSDKHSSMIIIIIIITTIIIVIIIIIIIIVLQQIELN
jgi:hypothetical protein